MCWFLGIYWCFLYGLNNFYKCSCLLKQMKLSFLSVYKLMNCSVQIFLLVLSSYQFFNHGSTSFCFVFLDVYGRHFNNHYNLFIPTCYPSVCLMSFSYNLFVSNIEIIIMDVFRHISLICIFLSFPPPTFFAWCFS